MRLTAAHRRGALAPALPMPYPVLENARLRLRRGQLSLTVAAPGVGKSQLWQNIAHRMNVPVLYWSGDTDQHDVATRAMAMWSGTTTEQVDERQADPAWVKYYGELLEKSSLVEWIFDSSITPRLVSERMQAFAEVHGQYPHLLVVDNLSNTVQHLGDEFAEQKEVMVAMQRLARESNCHVAVLAHATGEYENGEKPIPQSGAQNKLFKIPELGLTLHHGNEQRSRLALNVVKNRSGKADSGARHPVYLDIDFSRASVKGWR